MPGDLPGRSKYDLVGIDNHRAGYMATEHLIKAGAQAHLLLCAAELRRLQWRCEPRAIDRRWRADPEAVACVRRETPKTLSSIRAILKKRPARPAFLCANDLQPVNLVTPLMDLGRRVRTKSAGLGFHDEKMLAFSRVPLPRSTSLRHNLGKSALSVMLERIAHLDLPTRDGRELRPGSLRKNCGAARRRD